MSSGLYAHTTRGVGTVLTAAVYNADHNNHITNANPLMHGAYSDTVAQMKLQSDPGTLGAEILAATLAAELEALRFVIKRIAGTTFWYEVPATSLGLIGGGLPLNLAFASNPLRLRRTENDTVEREIQTFESGSGVGNKLSNRIVGGAANAVVELRQYLGTTELWRQTIALRTWAIAALFQQHIDIAEIAVPANPAANHARLYAKDDAGITKLAWRDSAGLEHVLGQVLFVARSYAEYVTNVALSATIPADDTVPLVTEGTEILSAAITIRNAAGRVRIRTQGQVFASTLAQGTIAVFRGSTCLASKGITVNTTLAHELSLEVEDAPGSVGPHTYSVRAGPDSGSMYYNGTTTRRLGGSSKATLVIEEIA